MGAIDFSSNILGRNNQYDNYLFRKNPSSSLVSQQGPDGRWDSWLTNSENKQGYWGTQLQNYNNNKFQLDLPTFESPFQRNQSNNYGGIDYAQQFRDNTQPQMNQMRLKTGLVLQNSSDTNAQLLGQNMVRDSINVNPIQTPDLTKISFNQSAQQDTNTDASQTTVPDVSHLTGQNMDYGQQFLNVGTQLGSQLASSLGGQVGQIASKAVGAAGSVVSSVKNLRALNAAGKAAEKAGTSIEGLGKAKTGNAMAIAGAAADLLGSFMPEKTEYSGPKGDITQTMDTVYDGISDAAMAFGPVGMIVGGAMKGAAFLGKGVNALGGGTDGMTTTDAILGSSFLSLTPFGLINGFGGRKADTITKDEQAFETVGASYTGTNQAVNSALQKSGKKYGAFSNSARKKANREIAEAKRQQAIITDIADETTDRFAIRDSMSAINGNRRALAMYGGYDQSAIRAARHGMVIQAKRIVSQYNISKKKEKFQKGGTLEDPFVAYLNSLPEYQQDSTNYRVKDYWEFNGRPKNFGEAIAKGMFTFQEDGWHANSVQENPSTGEIEFMKSDKHPSHQKEIDWYNSEGGTDFRNKYELIKSSPYWKYVKRGSVQEYKEGGSFNVIPEGALHARLHNMENADNLTKKGIPVVVEKDGGELEQQAEIEREEIIFRLEVTKKLEELAKDGSDKAAIEAGKLLVEEILNNTIDNTNRLL